MWFSDIDLPRSLLLWDSLADVIVTSRCARHIQDPAWRMEVMRLKHVDFGGATKVMNLHVHMKGHQSFSVELEESLVIAQCVFSPTNWVQRCLSQLECGNILDIPEAMQKSLSPPLWIQFLNDVRFIPERVLLQVLDCLNLDDQIDGKVEHGCPQKEGHCSLPWPS